MSMEAQRQAAIDAIFANLENSGLPAGPRNGLYDALAVLFDSRPSSLNQLMTVAQAIKSPTLPNLWARAEKNLPRGKAYTDLRDAITTIQELF